MPSEARILSTLRARGLRDDRGLVSCPAPGHGRGRGDANPSLSVRIGRDDAVLLNCFAGCSLDDILRAFGHERRDLFPPRESKGSRPASSGPAKPSPPPFTGDDAADVWKASLSRARDDDAAVERDSATWHYLAKRGLAEAHELGAVGVLGEGMHLPSPVAAWPRRGYRVVAPLFDVGSGHIANIQSRHIGIRTPKTLVPRGSRASGTCFANSAGQALLRGEPDANVCAVLGEGLTDTLALSIVLEGSAAILGMPGVGTAESCVGPWVRDVDLVVATDGDDSGDRIISAVAAAAYRQGARRVRRLVWPEPARDACDALQSLAFDQMRQFLDRIVLSPNEEVA